MKVKLFLDLENNYVLINTDKKLTEKRVILNTNPNNSQIIELSKDLSPELKNKLIFCLTVPGLDKILEVNQHSISFKLSTNTHHQSKSQQWAWMQRFILEILFYEEYKQKKLAIEISENLIFVDNQY